MSIPRRHLGPTVSICHDCLGALRAWTGPGIGGLELVLIGKTDGSCDPCGKPPTAGWTLAVFKRPKETDAQRR